MPNSITSRPSSAAARAITWAASCTPWPPIPVSNSSRSVIASTKKRRRVAGWASVSRQRKIGGRPTEGVGGSAVGSKPVTGVLIVDDEEDMRALLRSTIEIANEGLHVAGEAVDGEDAVTQWREKRPERVVPDQRMPGATGLEVAERILAEHPDQAIILFSAYLDPDIT